MYLLLGSVAPPCWRTLSGLRVMMVLTGLVRLSCDWMSTEYPASLRLSVATEQLISKVAPPTEASRTRMATTFREGPENE